MTFTQKFDIEIVFCLVAATAVSSFVVWQRNMNREPARLQMPVVVENSTDTVAVATPVPPVMKVDTSSQTSPDGTKKVMVTTTHITDSTLSYILKTADITGENEHTVYIASASASPGVTIPFNSWSPDNRYIFIENADGNALVFTATGEEIVPGEQYIDVGEIFNASGRTDSYHVTTGWASPTLLIVNTLTPENTKGHSYWFEVPSQAIYQLSSEF